MTRKLDELPQEILLSIAEDYLPNTTDLLNFRRVSKTMAEVGVSAMSNRKTTLYVTPSSTSLRSFLLICEHPVLSKTITEVVYVGDLHFAHHFASDSYAVGRNAPDMDALDRVYGIPEYNKRRLNQVSPEMRFALQAARSSEFAIFRTGLASLPRLFKITFAIGWPKHFRQSTLNSSARRNSSIRSLFENTMSSVQILPPIWQEDESRAMRLPSDSKAHDWVGLNHVLAAAADMEQSGRAVDVAIQNVRTKQWLSIPLQTRPSDLPSLESPIDFHTRSQRSMFDVLKHIRSIDLTYTYSGEAQGWYSHDFRLARLLEKAVRLKKLRLACNSAVRTWGGVMYIAFKRLTLTELENLSIESVESNYRHELIPDGTDHRLLGFETDLVLDFLQRHKTSLRSLLFRNILTTHDRPGCMMGRPSRASINPYRACLAEMDLSEVSILVDVYNVSDESHEDLLWRQQDVLSFAHSLDLAMQPAKEDMTGVFGIFDFGPWLTRPDTEDEARREWGG